MVQGNNCPTWVLIAIIMGTTPLAATDYYVSSSGGDDGNDGLSQATPFASIFRVNALNLQPGDRVLFKCGDIWRAEMLEIVWSGTQPNPIVFTSYPEGCGNKPVLSGARPISGWSQQGQNLYVADLAAGANAGLFPLGVNQLFRDGQRLALGRWPNLDAGNGGYATIESQPADNQIRDDQLPAEIWNGAAAHIKGMRWYLVNREVTAVNGVTLTLNEDAGCWANDCTGWGYFLNHSLATLDRDGEWFYDASAQMLYLYSTSGIPTNIECSVVMADSDQFRGAIILGRHLQEHISHVTIENFEIRHWDMNGITTPTNLETHDNDHLIIRNNHIIDVDAIGINLQTWVWNAAMGPNGWRGGHDLLVENNLVRGANHMGINTFSYNSLFQNNVLEDIGLIENVGFTGLGCGNDNFGGFCTEYGDGLRVKIDQPDYSGFGNTIRCNRLVRIGHNGIDIFGSNNLVENNFIAEACFSKGDCGAVRTFGTGSLATTNLFDVTIQNNIVVDTIGNTDGAHAPWQPPFGIGLYIDNFSSNVEVLGNTIINATIDGILYQRSTGRIVGNTLFNNNSGTMFRGQVGLYSATTAISELTQNVLYAQQSSARTLTADTLSLLSASNFNYFFNGYVTQHIGVEGPLRTLNEWQNFSGMDANSVENWFTLNGGDPPLGEIFYNDSKTPLNVDLGGSIYQDLDQNQVTGSFVLQPFTSRVLIPVFICNPTASVSGDTTICAGGSATIEVALTGTPPWDITWSDGLIQNGVTQNPLTRIVSPAATTDYRVASVSDASCAGAATGSATVIVGDVNPLQLDPPAAAQGLSPLTFTAQIPCDQAVSGWDWFHQGNLIASDVNPYTLGFMPMATATLEVHVHDDLSRATTIAGAIILVPLHPEINQDLNGDGCNTIDDLYFMADRWRDAVTDDPDGNGFIDVRDFLYINVDDDACLTN